MRQKSIGLLLALGLMSSLVGCAAKEETTTPPAGTETTPTTTEATPAPAGEATPAPEAGGEGGEAAPAGN
jgi:hypothetical protein